MSDPVQRNEAELDGTSLLAELHDLTCNLRSALDQFRFESRLNDLAEKEMPDARHRLDHVLRLTDSAAHRTLDLVEQSCPPAERTAREAAGLADPWARFRARTISPEDFRALVTRMDAFLRNARTDSETVRANLAEVLLAQGFQDLTGQIIRSVMKLVSEVERTLSDLTRIARGEQGTPAMPEERTSSSTSTGPAIPGVDSDNTVVNDQQDVDALLSGLGM